jgi:DNA topoisomerase-3
MSKALIIAEKPSVANDIARALGGFTKSGDYFESDDYVLSSAVGHLVEITAPEDFEVKRGKWSFTNLPVIPPHFDLRPIDRTQDRLKLLTRLIKRKDISRLINACDAGREGELIFRLIVQHAKARQPIDRLWLQSMTPSAIRDGFARLRAGRDMEALADAARSRSEADWLVGINGTRAMTAFNSREGGFFLTTVGRVQTPTLAVVVEREEKIRRFVARDYFEIEGTFGAAAGDYLGKWFDPEFKKSDDPEHRADRLWDRDRAEAIANAVRGKNGTVSEETKPSSQVAPALFDLTTLQREANGRFGFSAKTTLSLAQALYERHKVLTYPRTDSRALPEDYPPTVRQTLDMLSQSPAFGQFARTIVKQDWIQPKNKRVFDNAKVSDHFAIIPTLQPPKNLTEAEHKLYDLVVRRFLAVFFPAAEYRVTTRITVVEEHKFKTEGRVLVNPGWLAIYGRDAAIDGVNPNLVPVTEGESVLTREAVAKLLQTRPPARYSEATLLSAMEGAGKTLDDDELREAMAAKGLGTPATRAAIIEGLIAEKYLIREGRELIPTAKAFQLLTLLRGLGVSELTLPELTGEWEQKLARMERGQLEREQFMDDIAAMTRQIVERARNYAADTVPGDYATLTAPCPNCGATVKENYKRFACTNCDFSITKIPGGRQFEIPEIETLLRDRVIGPLSGFRSKMGRPFSAILKLSDELKLEFDFGQNNADDDNAQPVDFSNEQPLGPCPKCGNRVFAHGMSYLCEKAVGPERSCDFRSGREILQQPIEPEQMKKLLASGRTDLLTGFVSARTRRKFKAFLVRGPDGKVSFEFDNSRAKAKKGEGDEGGAKSDDDHDAASASARAGRGKASRGEGSTARKTSPPARTSAVKGTATSVRGAQADAAAVNGAHSDQPRPSGTAAVPAKSTSPRPTKPTSTRPTKPTSARPAKRATRTSPAKA